MPSSLTVRGRVANRALIGMLAALGLIAVSSGAEAVSCKVKGGFTVTQVTGPACLSPIDFCATLVYTGDLAGTSTFTGSSITPTVDTPTTGVVLVTGDNVIQTKVGGNVITKDALVLRTTGNGDFAEVDTVVSGTGAWAGAVGAIRAEGTFANGSGTGNYIGEICGG